MQAILLTELPDCVIFFIEKKVRNNRHRKEVIRHVYCRLTHPFQIFQSHQQRVYAGVSGSVGAQKRHPSDRERGFYASGMERRVKRKLKPAEDGFYVLKKNTGFRMGIRRIT